MEARSRIQRASVSVLVAWAEPEHAATAKRIGAGAFRHVFDRSSGDVPTRIRAGLAAAEARLRTGRVSRARGSGRVDHGLTGIGVAVLDGSTAWTATRGAIDAYVVRDARLASIGRATPRAAWTSDGSDDVLETSLIAGDTLLLASRDLLRELGPEELKSAALTLHPAAAAEHLRRLFAVHGGRGSDAALPIDVTLATRRRRDRHPAEPRIRAATGQRSSVPPARRAALGLASFASVIAIVALLVVVLPRGEERVAAQHLSLTGAVTTASDRLARADNVVAQDRAAALDLYRAAWDALDGAATTDAGDADAQVIELLTRITGSLDSMRGSAVADIRPLSEFESPNVDPTPGAFVRGPDGDLYVIDPVASVVIRIDAEDGDRTDVVHRGDRGGDREGRIGRPVQLERAGGALLILDDDARLWRWQPSEADRGGTLTALELSPDDGWSASIGDLATRPDPSGFRVYVVDPSVQNILRFQPTLDGRSFTRSDYLVVDDETVTSSWQLHIDERVYALTDDDIRRYEFGRAQQFRIDVPPDDSDIRPGQDYQLVAGADRDGTRGHLYVYDAAWDRIVVIDKVDGSFVRQWTAPAGDDAMSDMVSLSVTTGIRKQPDTLHWLTPSGVHEAVVPWMTAAPDDASETRREGRRKGRSR